MDSAKQPSPITSETPAPPVSIGAIFKLFLTAGAISFGGGVVAYLREYVVRDQKWLDDDGFLDALELSETLPGLNSVNMSVIIGDRLRGVAGAAAAVAGLVIPGVIVVMTLGVAWNQQRHNTDVNAALVGVAAAAVGLLTIVTLQLGHKQFIRFPDLLFIVATFAAVSLFKFSLLVVLLTLGPLATLYYLPRGGREETAHYFRHLRERLHSRHAHWRH
ncbi:MAG TPA: chromate transporter [Candidatus Binataceae bacterium]|nr:chromate transporter [Candidatus Binataceae bacterium]